MSTCVTGAILSARRSGGPQPRLRTSRSLWQTRPRKAERKIQKKVLGVIKMNPLAKHYISERLKSYDIVVRETGEILSGDAAMEYAEKQATIFTNCGVPPLQFKAKLFTN